MQLPQNSKKEKKKKELKHSNSVFHVEAHLLRLISCYLHRIKNIKIMQNQLICILTEYQKASRSTKNNGTCCCRFAMFKSRGNWRHNCTDWFQPCCPLTSSTRTSTELQGNTGVMLPPAHWWHQHKLELIRRRQPTCACYLTDWGLGRNECALNDNQPLAGCRPHQCPGGSCWQRTAKIAAILHMLFQSWRPVWWFPEGTATLLLPGQRPQRLLV